MKTGKRRPETGKKKTAMTNEQSARAYQQFTAALSKWWATPGRHAFRKPELADFTEDRKAETGDRKEEDSDPLDESPQSERAAKPTKKPATK
jgi:hypothetical protein